LKVFLYILLYGHDNISILDGGLKKWVRDGYPVTTDEPEVEVNIVIINFLYYITLFLLV
jgi:3-mercaptopyruvate sulfurtransferase SseA